MNTQKPQINPANKYRQILLEAILFFTQKGKMKYPSKTMIYKLLAEVDFRHFRETGQKVTNLKYLAYPYGPVPAELNNEITSDKEIIVPTDFGNALRVEKINYTTKNGDNRIFFNFVAGRKADLKYFTPRQVRIMEEVAEIYKNTSPSDASKASHEPDKPWTKTVKEKGEGAEIDLFETIELSNSLPKEILIERMKEKEAMIFNYSR